MYYVIWVEGLSLRSGEKVKRLTNHGYETTTKMTEALRVKSEDINDIKHYLKRHGVSDWALKSAFSVTSYAPSGTVYNSKLYQL